LRGGFSFLLIENDVPWRGPAMLGRRIHDQFATGSSCAQWSFRRRLTVCGTASPWRSGSLVSRNHARGCRCTEGDSVCDQKRFFLPRDAPEEYLYNIDACDSLRSAFVAWLIRRLVFALDLYMTPVLSAWPPAFSTRARWGERRQLALLRDPGRLSNSLELSVYIAEGAAASAVGDVEGVESQTAPIWCRTSLNT